MSASLALLSLASLATIEDAETVNEERPHPRVEMLEQHKAPADPLSVEIAYTAEIMANARGGARRGSRYMDNFDLVVGADLDALLGWEGATAGLYGLYNNGRSISELVGDAQGVSNIEAGVSAVRLYEAWLDQKFGDHVSLRAGLYDLNSEFDVLDTASLFVGSGHGIGTDFGQSGRNGPSIFPSTSLAARLAVEPAEGWVLRAALLDAVPGNPDHPSRTAIRFGKREGALIVGEVQAPVAGGKFLLGHWRYSASFDRIDGTGKGRGNSGTYLRAEFRLADLEGARLDGFGRIGVANGIYNDFSRFVGAGLTISDWISGREGDVLGVAVAAAFTSSPLRRRDGADRAEVALEMTYRAPLADWLAVQPSIQYVFNPSADPSIASALVFGLRSEISFGL